MRVEWTGYEDLEDDSPSFEKILRKKPHTEFEERGKEKPKKKKRVPRDDKE